MLDFLLHVDTYLTKLIADYGTLTYAILFAIIFAETGLVVTPFLPGDSLLFAAGTLAATGALRLDVVVVVLIAAAVLGDAVNYSVGRRLARTFLDDAPESSWMHKVVKREHVQRAHDFFDKHGGKAVVLARFVPIVRTFVPFVAGGASHDLPHLRRVQRHRRRPLGWHLRRRGLSFRQHSGRQARISSWWSLAHRRACRCCPIVFELIKTWRRPGSQEDAHERTARARPVRA